MIMLFRNLLVIQGLGLGRMVDGVSKRFVHKALGLRALGVLGLALFGFGA